jgi:hypothetical protein
MHRKMMTLLGTFQMFQASNLVGVKGIMDVLCCSRFALASPYDRACLCLAAYLLLAL